MTDDHYPKPYMNYDSSIIIVGVGRKNRPYFHRNLLGYKGASFRRNVKATG